MNKKIKITILLICSSLLGHGQALNGVVCQYVESGEITPLEGATLQWMGTSKGTVSNENGQFSLERIPDNDKLVVRFVGYQTDTLSIKKEDNNIKIILSDKNILSGITVSALEGAYISSRPLLTQVITGEGLRKAACCNLSESFESSASVDVSYSDAITGAKQIQMLGLAGVYSQLLLENTPFIRGLSTPFGLMYVPGSWMESINVSKGTASVVNGYESITGQIDIDYKKPETSKEKVFVNLFLNSMVKSELNFNSKIPVKEHVNTLFLLHFENHPLKIDHNHDGFSDNPLSTGINFMNRWDYTVPNKMEGRTMISYLYDTRLGGEMDFDKKTDKLTTNNYGFGVDNHKVNLISKNGILLKGEHESIGTIASFTYHDFNSFYGLNTYHAKQTSGYLNVIYSNFVDKKEQHKIEVGASYQIDAYKEQFNDSLIKKTESVPGLFAQYNFILKDKFILIGGMRIDYNSLYGLFWTPRLHLKWQVGTNSVIRATAGKGYRSANVFIENTSLMTSARTFVIEEKLKAEEAYNVGVSFTQKFKIKEKKCTFIVDYFYTEFVNQVTVNIDRDFTNVYFSNLNGRSFSHAAQAELTFYPFKRFEITAAYRFNYVKESIDGQLKEKALTSRHKAILNISYATKFERWKFNITAQLHGSTRMPDVYTKDDSFVQMEERSPAFMTFNAQITRKFKYFEIYLGTENFTNYKQKEPIIDYQNPFSEHFDASVVWGPITGISVYAGVRFTLKG